MSCPWATRSKPPTNEPRNTPIPPSASCHPPAVTATVMAETIASRTKIHPIIRQAVPRIDKTPNRLRGMTTGDVIQGERWAKQDKTQTTNQQSRRGNDQRTTHRIATGRLPGEISPIDACTFNIGVCSGHGTARLFEADPSLTAAATRTDDFAAVRRSRTPRPKRTRPHQTCVPDQSSQGRLPTLMVRHCPEGGKRRRKAFQYAHPAPGDSVSTVVPDT